MSELVQYGLTPQDTTKCVAPSETIPPIFQFKSRLDCLFIKINVVLNQEYGTLFYDRQLGSTIQDYVFDQDSSTTEEAIKEAIYNDLTSSIEDIQIDSITVEKKETVNGIEYDVEITITFENTQYTLKFVISQTGITVVQ